MIKILFILLFIIKLIVIKLIIRYHKYPLDTLKKLNRRIIYFMDTRLLVIAAPVLVAASWALYNIGRLAIQQIQRLSR